MKVYQNISPQFGRGIQRVAKAIEEYAPAGVEFTEYEQADLVIHHVIGVQNFHPTKTIDQFMAGSFPGQRQAVVQYCVATSEQPLPIWWFKHVWSHCDLVWSYYDLLGQMLNFPPDEIGEYGWGKIFYEAPLGVDKVFHGSIADRPKRPIFLVCTSGYIPETEGVLECVEAAARVGGRVLHLGPASLNLGPHVAYVEGISDQQLAALYKSCRFVSGLRRVEGFELPAAEGLCGGTVPICFDQPHYNRWFEDAAAYVTESSPAAVTDLIENIFREPTIKADAIDVSLAQRKFSWPRVVGGFWQRLLDAQTKPEIHELSAINRLPDNVDERPF